LLHADTERVTFSYKDYRHGARSGALTLCADEFLRRFLLHVLPSGFVRIRSYGLLANRGRHHTLLRCRYLTGRSRRSHRPLAPRRRISPVPCCLCGQGHLHRLSTLEPTSLSPRGPP
jgi:hypothetical protein